jgi:AcrR family transcriptional regulator
MRKNKVTHQLIIETTIRLIDELGIDKVSLNEIARKLEIKPPSLYKHIKSFEEIKNEVFITINSQLVNEITQKIKVEDKNALFKYCNFCREFALKYPARYLFISNFIIKDKLSYPESMIFLRDYLAIILVNNYSISKTEIRYRARAIRSLIHGFVMYELSGGWTEIVSADKSFKKSIEYISQF